MISRFDYTFVLASLRDSCGGKPSHQRQVPAGRSPWLFYDIPPHYRRLSVSHPWALLHGETESCSICWRLKCDTRGVSPPGGELCRVSEAAVREPHGACCRIIGVLRGLDGSVWSKDKAGMRDWEREKKGWDLSFICVRRRFKSDVD